MSRIATVQMTTTDELERNLAVVHRSIEEASAEGAALVAFPEVAVFMGRRAEKLAVAEPLSGPIVSGLSELAAKHSITVLLGSYHERIAADPDRVHNTSVLIGADGEILAVYRKMKLFDLELPELKLKESETIAPGTAEPPVVDTALGRLGLTICFDLRFSELYLGLRERGAEIVFIPSNFTVPTGTAHWEIMLRARAIESQVYVVAPAQWGRHSPVYSSYGHSMVVDPWGKIVSERAEGTGISYAEVDLDRVRQVRRDLPMARDGAARARTASSAVVAEA